ncbi:MAG TPA: hypothetical protein VFJ85_12495 [Acidimicrobiales bacterium]|nr:hypothetical protein [Acidimicrobiales bacterium]
MTDHDFDEEELAALALAADPDAAVGPGAVPVWEVLEGDARHRPLPEWYMPLPAAGLPLLHGWRRRLAIVVIVAFLLITAYGLCNTYGPGVP